MCVTQLHAHSDSSSLGHLLHLAALNHLHFLHNALGWGRGGGEEGGGGAQGERWRVSDAVRVEGSRAAVSSMVESVRVKGCRVIKVGGGREGGWRAGGAGIAVRVQLMTHYCGWPANTTVATKPP